MNRPYSRNKLEVFTVTREVERLQNVYVLAMDEDHAEELAEGFSENDWEDNDLDGNSQVSVGFIEVESHPNKKFANQAINSHWLD